MADFFRFPHTPHLAWLGTGSPRDDKVLGAAEAAALLAGPVCVEEKLDGANLGLSVGADGDLRVQNRGQYLVAPYQGQFARLAGWLAQHGQSLRAALTPGLMLFGEWCAARHSVEYSALPDWFIAFDLYDRAAGRFWSVARRAIWCGDTGLATVPIIAQGASDCESLQRLLTRPGSAFGGGPAEGLIIRRDGADWLEARAKLVRPDFTQAIDSHWRHRRVEWNRVAQRQS